MSVPLLSQLKVSLRPHLKANLLVVGIGWRWWYQTLIIITIFLEHVENILGVRMHQIGPRLPQRMHDVVDEAHLRLLDCRILPIAHRTDIHASRSLLVTLQEEFLHQQRHPASVERKWLRRVAQIRAMHEILKDLNPVGVVVQQKHARSYTKQTKVELNDAAKSSHKTHQQPS